MSTENINIISDLPTGQANISFGTNKNCFEILDNQAYDLINVNIKDLNEDFILYIGSLSLRRQHNLNEINKILSNTGCSVFCDINLRTPWYDKTIVEFCLHAARWLKLNTYELDVISEMFDIKSASPDRASILLNMFNIEKIFLTNGGSGTFCYTSDGFIWTPSPPSGHFVNSIGTGDAFSSVCIAGLVQNKDPEYILTKATEFGSKICTIEGAVSFSEDFYFKLADYFQKP